MHQTDVRDFEITADVRSGVVAEGTVGDAGGIVDDDLGCAEVGDCLTEDGGEGSVRGDVSDVGVDFG